MLTKKCNACGKVLSVSEFDERIVSGKRYLRTACKQCECKKRNDRLKRGGVTDTRRESQKRYLKKLKESRAKNDRPAHWIWRDSRGSARKKGLNHTLSEELISTIIANECQYCGETELRMTLDRIDNSKGYTEDNVVPACIRCNYARRDMPYEAWLLIAPGFRKAREQGVFGEWVGRCR